MTAYTKSTNFATKDTLTSGDPLKIVKGTEINTEFDNIATAVNSKSDTASPTFTGTVTIPLLSYAGTTLSAAVTGTGKMVLDTSPTLVTPALGTPSSGILTNCTGVQYNGFKNRIINGGMALDQRNAGASQTITAAAALAYTVDRWYAYCTGANVTGQQIAGAYTSSQYRYQFTGAASVTAIGFGQRIEQKNCFDLANTTATLSCYISNSLLTTVTWTAYYATTTADTFGSLASPTVTQIATGTFTVSSTRTQYTTNISIPSAATTGIQILFTVGAQTSGTWVIDSVQLEKGSTATSFDYRPYGTEFQLCQRYFQQSYAVGLVAGDTSGLGIVGGTAMNNGTNNAGNNGIPISFKVPMRATATVTTYAAYANSSGSITIAKASTPSATYAATADTISSNGFKVFSTATGSGGTAGTATEFLLQYFASAEL